MPAPEHFEINSPPVVLETIDEETIIVNLESGCYYDLNHSGGHVLHSLKAGSELEAAIDSVASRYEIDRELVAEPIRAMVAELVGEGILTPVDEPAEAAAPAAPDGPVKPRRYEAPALTKYTDMQELLLLDPVHEVHEAGWPRAV